MKKLTIAGALLGLLLGTAGCVTQTGIHPDTSAKGWRNLLGDGPLEQIADFKAGTWQRDGKDGITSTVEMWATGHAEMILDQLANFEAAYQLTDTNPLGSAAGYGVPLPLDRKRTSELLGFSRPIHNCFGASMARGECEASLLSALAQLMCVLSRLAEDMILFSMPEFAYFKLPREYCTGSSIMPQKFNPDVLELVRGKTAQVIWANPFYQAN